MVLPLDDHWDSYIRLVAQGGHPVVAELRVLPAPRPGADDYRTIVEDVFDGDNDLYELDDFLPINEPPEGGLSARALRQVRLGEAVTRAYEQLGRWFESGRPPVFEGDAPSAPLLSLAGFRREALAAPRRPGRRGRDDNFYAVIASFYVEAVARRSAQPVKDAATTLSEAWGATYTDTYVRDLLNEARRRELLTRPPRGRAGGELTEKARKLLIDDSEER